MRRFWDGGVAPSLRSWDPLPTLSRDTFFPLSRQSVSTLVFLLYLSSVAHCPRAVNSLDLVGWNETLPLTSGCRFPQFLSSQLKGSGPSRRTWARCLKKQTCRKGCRWPCGLIVGARAWEWCGGLQARRRKAVRDRVRTRANVQGLRAGAMIPDFNCLPQV